MNVMSDPESKRTLRDRSNTCPWSKWIKIIEIGDNVLSIPFEGLLMSLGDLSLLLIDLLSSLSSHKELSSLKTSAIVSRRYMSSTSERSSGLELSGAQVCHSRSISLAIGVARVDDAASAQLDIELAIKDLLESTKSNAVIVVVSGTAARRMVFRMATHGC
jgi:hypothetical protein